MNTLKAAVFASLSTLAMAADSLATITAVGPFRGNLGETWESFNNALRPIFHYLPGHTSIMGGGATIANNYMVIYEPGVANLDLVSSGRAQVSDGVKGMGVYRSGQTAVITFLHPIFDFGAYWGSVTFGAPEAVSIRFGDGSTTSFTYEKRDATGALDWHGWHFSAGISSLSYSGTCVVIDGLQANAPIPEPSTYVAGTMLTLVFGAQGLYSLRRRQQSV